MACSAPLGSASLSDAEVAGLAAAGFADTSVAFTHQVGDGLHSAIIKATRPTDPAVAAAGPATAHRELPVGQCGRC